MKGRILISGGAGFIGTNLASSLLDKGFDVLLFDNLSRAGSSKNLDYLRRHRKSSSRLTFRKGDVRNFSAVKEAVKKADIIFHLAAQVAVTLSFKNPREDFEINALGSFNVLEAARLSGHKPIVVYSSTNKVYGPMENVRLNGGKMRYRLVDLKNGVAEDYPLYFHSPYGCSNGVADQYTRDYHNIYGLPTIVFRQSCIYGPRQMGIEDQGWLAHFAITAYLGQPITIYGDGRQVRDLLYVDDLIGAYLKAVQNIDKSHGQIYNIGGGNKFSFSLLECIKFLENKMKKKIKINFDRARPGDQKIYISNNSKLKEELGWEPKISPQVGIVYLLDWIKKNNGLFR